MIELVCASQGMEGYQAAVSANESGAPFELAFVDMRMPPGWDGAETIERIRQKHPALRCVICTAYSDIDQDTLRGRLGRDLLILQKPFDPKQVLSLVHGLGD